jgi:hypothetical protein
VKKNLLLLLFFPFSLLAQEIVNPLVTPELIKKNKVKKITSLYYQRADAEPLKKTNLFTTGYIEYNRDGKPMKQVLEGQQVVIYTYGPHYTWTKTEYFDGSGSRLKSTHMARSDSARHLINYTYKDLQYPQNNCSAVRKFTLSGKILEDITYDTLGKIRSGYIYQYDAKDSLQRTVFIQGRIQVTNNTKGQMLLKKILKDDGSFETQTRYTYNAEGLMQTETDSAANGKVYVKEYTYDPYGSLLTIIMDKKTVIYDRQKEDEENNPLPYVHEKMPIADPVPVNNEFPSLPYSQRKPLFLKNGLLKEYYDNCYSGSCPVTEYVYEFYK